MPARRVRRNALMRRAGPYIVRSHSNGLLSVYPHWAGMHGKPGWLRETEADEAEAGGPGVFSRMGLADSLEKWLNVPHGAEHEELLRDGKLLVGDYIMTLTPREPEEPEPVA